MENAMFDNLMKWGLIPIPPIIETCVIKGPFPAVADKVEFLVDNYFPQDPSLSVYSVPQFYSEMFVAPVSYEAHLIFNNQGFFTKSENELIEAVTNKLKWDYQKVADFHIISSAIVPPIAGKEFTKVLYYGLAAAFWDMPLTKKTSILMQWRHDASFASDVEEAMQIKGYFNGSNAIHYIE